MEQEKRKHRVCFTGHRPEKINCSEKKIKAWLEMEIRKSVSNGQNVFISGMARGTDIWAAEVVLKVREEMQNVKLICASPFPSFESRWNEEWKKRYQSIMEKADYVQFINKVYCPSCFQARNEWMVDCSSKVIAIYNGSSGGTRNTLMYAKKRGVPITMYTSKEKDILDERNI